MFGGDPAEDIDAARLVDRASGQFWAMVWDELGVIGDRGERLHEPGLRLRSPVPSGCRAERG